MGRLPRLRATTANACSAYPFAAATALPAGGVHLGSDLTAGGRAFTFDPFAAYASGVVSNPNVVVIGSPGTGKSALIKAFLHRSAMRSGRWIAVCDPKGEYGALAELLGLDQLRLAPGGTERLNPLDRDPTATPEENARRHTLLVAALTETVLERRLAPIEDAALGRALRWLADQPQTATLVDLTRLLATPPGVLAEQFGCGTDTLASRVEAVHLALDKLLARDLRGMFDGPTTTPIGASSPGIVVDLSAVAGDLDALRLVLVAATAALTPTLTDRSRDQRRILVLDEAWALLGHEPTARFLQASWKLGRAAGVANIAVVHRLSDLRSQSDDGTTAAKLAAGLLADTATRVVFRQASDQTDDARHLLGLTAPERDLIARLTRGRALWQLGARTAVIAHTLSPAETALADTDQHMRP